MMRSIDAFLNKITMYRLVLYELLFLLAAAVGLGALHLIPYSPLQLLYSTAVLLGVTLLVNKVFAVAFDAPSNPESAYITALILVLVITPAHALGDAAFLSIALWAGAWAVASKYLLTVGKKHLFNPAAVGIAITALFLGQSASWWVGTMWMLPFVLIGGFLVVRKIRRTDLVLAFSVAVAATMLILGLAHPVNALHTLYVTAVRSSFFFLATVMLTEPLTTPPTRFLRILYGVLVGFFFTPQVHFGSFYFTPELALLAGNVFSYLVSPKQKLILALQQKVKLTPDTYEFVFRPEHELKFSPGQYMEWTLAHAKSDARGIRRYFTLASSPTERELRLGVKFYAPMSSFKQKLLSMRPGDTIVASQLAGDFTLPSKKEEKLVFIAGGIGVTPFRSMLQYLLDTKEKRDIKVLYSNKTVEDVAYVDLFDRAERELGIETLPVFTVPTKASDGGEFPSAIDEQLILSQVPDYHERTFYLSGPHGMVTAFSQLLSEMGVPGHRIKKDFFPGFA